jgi:tetraacyldisaccharide 4'-kinase
LSQSTNQDLRPFWQRLLLNYWYNNKPLFLPLRLLVHGLEKITEWWLKRQPPVIKQKEQNLPPVVVVGNFIVGGAGKTPVVRHLVDKLKERGFNPGVISRGYGREGTAIGIFSPGQQNDAALASRIGDEPAWLAKALECPIAVGSDRTATLQALHAAHGDINVVVSDDGMQHQALKRVFEIAVCDERGFGNGFLLPAGPLREPLSGANRVDAFVLTMGEWDRRLLSEVSVRKPLYRAQLKFRDWRNVETDQRITADRAASTWIGKTLVAVAGLATPAKFFKVIDAQGLSYETVVVPDHFQYPEDFLQKLDADIILTTGKDAVKWRNDRRVWIAEIEFDIPDELINAVEDKLRGPQDA